MEPTPGILAAIGRWIARLDLASDELQRCTVVVEQPHHWHGLDKSCSVRIELAVRDSTIAVCCERGDIRRSLDELYVAIAIASAFRAITKQLRNQ